MPPRYSFGAVMDLLTTAPTIRKFKREGWKNLFYIGAQWPDSNSMNTRPYLYGVDYENLRVPWLATPVDMYAQDWIEVFV